MSFAIASPAKIREFDNPAKLAAKVESVRPQVPLPVPERKALLRNLYYAILDNADYLCEALRQDLHRNPSETRMLEIAGMLDEIKVAIDNVDKWAAPTKAEFDIKNALGGPMVTHEPYGLVLVIGPWNYPYLCVVAPIVSALAAGNHIVLKPSEMVPHASEAVSSVLEKALPSSVFTVVSGSIPETTELLKQKFDKICFTGSTPVGKVISRAAAEHLTPVLLELGGKSPTIITKSADLELAAKRVAWGKFVNAGQTCIAPDYVLVDSSVEAQFIEHLKAAVRRMYPNLTKDSDDFAHVVSDRLFGRAEKLVATTKGKIELQWGKPDAATRFYPPTLVSGVKLGDSLMSEELFGPILPLISYAKIEDVVPLIKVNDTPLATYIFTNRKADTELITTNIRTGAVLVNDALMQAASSVLPFGGVGQSGSGAYHGKFGFNAFSQERPFMKQPGFIEKIMSFRYPPYTRKQQNTTQKLMVPMGVWWPRSGPVKKSFLRRIPIKVWAILVLIAATVHVRSKL